MQTPAQQHADWNRFWALVDKDPDHPDGCWEWMGNVNRDGYGEFSLQYRNTGSGWRSTNVRAHRQAYEWLVGPIPPEMTIEHECVNRTCVRPAVGHCIVLSRGENALRGTGPAAQNKRKTHCIRGHELAGDNLTTRAGRRECRTCTNAARRARRAETKGADDAAA